MLLIPVWFVAALGYGKAVAPYTHIGFFSITANIHHVILVKDKSYHWGQTNRTEFSCFTSQIGNSSEALFPTLHDSLQKLLQCLPLEGATHLEAQAEAVKTSGFQGHSKIMCTTYTVHFVNEERLYRKPWQSGEQKRCIIFGKDQMEVWSIREKQKALRATFKRVHPLVQVVQLHSSKYHLNLPFFSFFFFPFGLPGSGWT